MRWYVSSQPVDYREALQFMEGYVELCARGERPDLIWLLEHPPLYTRGHLSKEEDLLDPDRFPVFETNRGGQYTYHGPGQRVVYLMLSLGKHVNIHNFVRRVESWVQDALHLLGVDSFSIPEKPGIWVQGPKKIGSLGFRFRRWVSFHGFSLNVNPCLEHFSGIRPCGIQAQHVTSLAQLGFNVSLQEVDAALHQTVPPTFKENSSI